MNRIIKILTFYYFIELILNFFKKLRNKKKENSTDCQIRFKKDSVDNKTQMKFNSKKDIFKGHDEVNKTEWDLPDVSTFSTEDQPHATRTKPVSEKTKLTKIKTFEEFYNSCAPSDILSLDTKCGIKIDYNLINNKFKINNQETLAEIENVVGMTQIGNSRIDGHPIISLKIRGAERPLLLKVLKDENRFQNIRDINDTFSNSNIDSIDSMRRAISGEIINGKYSIR